VIKPGVRKRRPAEPLREMPAERPEQQASYQTWHETRQAAPADGE